MYIDAIYKKESDEGEFGFTDNEWDNCPEEVKNELISIAEV